MDEFQLLIDLHRSGLRQGPGGDAETELALQLARVDRQAPLQIADVGCGTGASTLVLAKLPRAQITAVDFVPEFLHELAARAGRAGVAERIVTQACSMAELPFGAGELDVIWSEGAIYNLGFARGVAAWREHLKPDGLLAVSEITWTTDTRPAELQEHWDREYPGIDVASAKIRVLEQQGYTPVGYFTLPEHCWLGQYYHPLQARFADFLRRHENCAAARALVTAEQREIALYHRYKAHYSYGFYLARRR